MTSPNPQEGEKPDWRDYGPWETCGAAIVRTQFIQGDPTRPGFIIADLHSCPIDQREEISRMIAAAPALLEALSFLANEVDAMRAFEDGVRQVIGHTNWSVLDVRLKEARAALLQATGGENGR